MSFCFLYNVVSENYSVQNSPWGEGGLLPAQCLNLICILHRHGYKLMSQDSREKFGVKSQMRGRGGEGKERKERKDMLKAGQSRGSIVCVNGVIIKQCGS